MKKLQLILLISFVIAGIVLISGCVSPEEGEESVVEEINFGYQPSTHQIAYMTAYEKGWWAEDLAPFGVTTINEFEFPTGAPEMQSMLAGDLDIAYVGAAPFIAALGSGLDAKVVAGVNSQGSDLVLLTDIPYESPEDLKGLTIATFPPGTIQDTILRNWLIENGLEPDADVIIKSMGPGDAIAAISAAQIDGAFLPHPAPALIEAEGTGRSVVASGVIMPEHACCVMVVSGDLIRNNPEMVTQIVKTHIKANDFNLENKEEAAQIFADKQGWDVNIVRASLDEWDGQWIADPNIIVESTVDYAEVQHELGYIEVELTQDDIFDLSFYEAATEE
ncbi:NitT/TauT family transport system substrate-binding protein [Methanohalophilus levihalophilus]|uniref:ABC transporter substrate-binding protein n=1 Tax=Methanohalophilus levihalophilus TaxID=1431282 RepID=UPI001AE120F2|nr:ABC transporter substrate-binding protein [Methanohalophilus levihalophilus]MBP2030198.1 NitT/TauT family transport system substrate-binding protein [Methanohalophilus levihalophilus]